MQRMSPNEIDFEDLTHVCRFLEIRQKYPLFFKNLIFSRLALGHYFCDFFPSRPLPDSLLAVQLHSHRSQ